MTPVRPIATVVIPTYDGVQTLAAQLRSLAQQDVAAFEVVVADNGSSDGTPHLARNVADRLGLDLRLVDAPEPGIGPARNAGAAAASADVLLFLDQDDRVSPGYVRTMTEALMHAEAVGARMDTSGNPPAARRARGPMIQERGLARSPFTWSYGCALGVRADVFAEVGGFPQVTRRGAEDVGLGYLLHRRGCRWAFVPEAVVHYRLRSGVRENYRQGRAYAMAGAVLYEHLRSTYPDDAAVEALRPRVTGLAGGTRLVLATRSRGDLAKAALFWGRRAGTARWLLDNRRPRQAA